MSSATEVLKRVNCRCSNETCQDKHRHVHLVQGRARLAQVYPRKFGIAICEGVAVQKRLETLGLQARTVMTVDEMRDAAPVGKDVESPSESLHEPDCSGMVAFDDISGQQLDPALMVKARKDEMTYFCQMGVYEKVDLKECWDSTGKAPIAVRWVDINKGDSQKPNYRSRLVAKEFNTGVCPELYAATPPSECLRLMLSLVASGQREGISLMYADVSRAYFYAKAVRPVYVKLPEEDTEPGDEHRCGKLHMSMYGTRDAALNWSLEYGDTLRAAGYVQGKANPCLFFHKGKGVSVMVHGDDFIAVGPGQRLGHLKETLENKYKIKTEQLGCGEGMQEEVRILNKIVRQTSAGIELEADPRHAEIVVKELGLKDARPSPVPGSKIEAKKNTNNDYGNNDKIKATTQARIDARSEPMSSVDTAKQSAGGQVWECGDETEIQDEDVDDQDLDAEAARLYRAVTARLNYIAPDRPDLGYAVKEAARNMSRPRESDLKRLRKIGKYLIGKPRLVSLFPWQSMPDRVTGFTDSDWAGCSKTAKSTSGGAICIGEHVVKTYCRQQRVVALSSAEAELYAMVAASAETLAIAAYAKDLGLDLKCEMYCD